MEIEVFLHIARLDDFKKGRSVFVKLAFANQYDLKLILKMKDIVINIPTTFNSDGMFIIRKKTIVDRLKLRKFIKYKPKK
ncbi:MAG: hypothetical protein J6T15_05295 [Bacilli bacterium]|nr:hypothetical protein [Bacilli bacterium]